MPVLVKLKALLQELNHRHVLADGITLVLALEISRDFEIERLRFERWSLFQILGTCFDLRRGLALFLRCRYFGRHHGHAALSLSSLATKSMMPCSISDAR